MSIFSKIGHGLVAGWWMFYATFWAMLLGFVISGVIQAYAKRESIEHQLGDDSFRSLFKALIFGSLSSSCSYAASALTKRLISKGANQISALAFMFSSTNLVLEIGIVLWRLMGWQFAAAEAIGGVVMVLLLKLIAPRFLKFPDEKFEDSVMEMVSSKPTLADAAGYTLGDVMMVRYELLIGFVIAGLISTLIPTAFFSHLFFTGHGFLGTLENVLIAPFIALISFVCSVGNIPFAATLWRFGISFGGAVSFIYADLISAPLLLIYRKYFGKNLAWRMLAVFWVVMSLGGLITEGIFQLFNWIPKRHQLRNLNESFGWNLDTVANIIALVVLIAVVVLAKSRKMSENQSFAIDPICKMQVRISDAPAKAEIAGATYYFCMEGCRDEFLKKHQA